MNEKELFNVYVNKMQSINDEYFKNVNRDLFNGHNSYLRTRMKGASFFNDEWIKKIEDCIYELGQIINNPLEVTKAEGELTPIELAKKINYESIQHLASHSQYVKDIDEEGNVIPSKILAQFHKEEIHTYENRFIATFIRRLTLFVEKRYDFIRSTVSFDTKDIFYIKNKSVVDGKEVEIETKVTVKKANEDSQSKIGREYVKRVEEMRRYVNYFYSSPFMKEFKTEKNVRKPILQTNIIRKNPYYRKCYETFLFIERFSSLGVEYALDTRFQSFNEKERKELNYILASNLLSLGSTETSKVYKKSNKSYKPKLLNSIDDEMFVYGDLVKGPIEYVRADSKYLEYLQSKVDKSIPKRPNKAEKEYFNEEIEYKKDLKRKEKELESLLKRIRRQIVLWEKRVLELIEQRNLEEAKEAEARLEALRKQENDILEKKRKEIIAAAMGDKAEIKAEKLAEIKKAEEETKAAEEASKKAIAEAVEKARQALKAEVEAHKEEIIEPQEEIQPVEVKEETVTEEPVVEEPKAEEPVVEGIKVEEPVVEAKVQKTKVKEKKPATKKAPAKKPAAKKAPAKKAKKPAPVVELAPVVEIKPEPQPEPEKAPVLKVEPEVVVEQAPVIEPVNSSETMVAEEPKVEEVKVEEKKPATKKAPIKKPVSKKAPAKKPVKEEIKPAKEEKPVKKTKSSGKTGENKKKPVKKEPKKVIKETPKVEPVEEPLPLPKEKVSILQKIPGKFIVKSHRGYVVSKTEFSNVKSKARIFDDFNHARRYKELFGGKVIKL